MGERPVCPRIYRPRIYRSCKEPDKCLKRRFSPDPKTVNVLTWATVGGAFIYVVSEYWWVPVAF